MKKFIIGIGIVSMVMMGTEQTIIPVEAATVSSNVKAPFEDENLYLYASTDNFKVERGVMYFKNKKRAFIKPTEKYIKNATLMNVAKVFLDKDRYTKAVYREGNVEKAVITSATSSMAADWGVTPIAYHFNLNKKEKTSLAKNVQISLFLDYQFYDTKTKKFNSPIFKTKLKSSLIELFGKKDGVAIYNHVDSLRQKYNKIAIAPDKPVKVYKKFGKIGVYSMMADTDMYVDFSY